MLSLSFLTKEDILMHNDKYVELKTEITKCILNNEEYKNEFYNNNLK